MKAYVIASGVVFAFITFAHILRFIAEGPRLLNEPLFIVTSLVAAGLTVWAWTVSRSSR